ncbi:unnamed protein product [Schistosoma curassoni]|uniref:EF-hand domain-containing protein n=1 Tax=Schistosoma curassoni TaxID=6186 RepID=A0A183JNF2_9TREM|nr:unnamed protein product [Schistosoma curassoni]
MVELVYRDEPIELYRLEQLFLKVLPCQIGRLKNDKTKSNKPKFRIRSRTADFTERDCPSGQLSKKKFIEVYSGFFPDGNAEKFCTHVFRTFDKDNSGRIDFKEFLLAINITSGGDPEEKLEWAYQMYDIDGNGTIERTEMVEIIRVSSCTD